MIGVVLLINIFVKGFLKLILIFIGFILGIIFVVFMGLVDVFVVVEVLFVYILKLFYFGVFRFEFIFILMMCIIVIVFMVELIGVYFVFLDIINDKLDSKRFCNGYCLEGLVVLFGGLFNIFLYIGFF